MTEPTDRSIPPVRITQVIPTAMIALIDTWRSTFSRFAADRKLGLAIIIAMQTTTSPTSG